MSSQSNEIISLLSLHHVKGWGRKKIWQLIQQFGSATAVCEAVSIPKNWERDWEACQKSGISIISYRDPNYPQALLNIPDFPLLLYMKGALQPADAISIALIGTRNATLYGKEAALRIASDLAQQGVTIISGLARGIDTAAHLGALKMGRTLAVIGSGFGEIYPKENLRLAEQISEQGALISEYPFHTPPHRANFPRRNRIVSGMSRGVVLIESPAKGGGMITMEFAKAQDKACFALPGRIDWLNFAGNHALLKSCKARLVERAEDLLEALNIPKNKGVTKYFHPSLSEEEVSFLRLVPEEEKSIEELVVLTQLPVMKLNVLLTRLVLKKVIKEFPGKIYKRING